MSVNVWCPWVNCTKSADQAVINSSALVDCTDLTFPMEAAVKYRVRGWMPFDTTANGDFKWRHAGPASPTLVRLHRWWLVPGATSYAGIATDTAFSGSDLAITGTGTTGGMVFLQGLIHNGANAGDFKLRFAQNSATNDTGAVVRAGAYIEWSVAR